MIMAGQLCNLKEYRESFRKKAFLPISVELFVYLTVVGACSIELFRDFCSTVTFATTKKKRKYDKRKFLYIFVKEFLLLHLAMYIYIYICIILLLL